MRSLDMMYAKAPLHARAARHAHPPDRGRADPDAARGIGAGVIAPPNNVRHSGAVRSTEPEIQPTAQNKLDSGFALARAPE